MRFFIIFLLYQDIELAVSMRLTGVFLGAVQASKYSVAGQINTKLVLRFSPATLIDNSV